jgi:membrane protein DedA with SNARE-associated domain
MFSGQFLVGDGHMDSAFLWSSISAVLGGFIGYGISRWIK